MPRLRAGAIFLIPSDKVNMRIFDGIIGLFGFGDSDSSASSCDTGCCTNPAPSFLPPPPKVGAGIAGIPAFPISGRFG